MKKVIKRDQKKHDYTTSNTLTVGLFSGSVVGFFIAMLFGVFGYSDEDSTTDWIGAATAVSATFISALAVVLVAQTLKATRDTLNATQKMADDQRRIGDAQTRPWLLVESRSIEDRGEFFDLHIRIKNYGSTPATNVQARMKIIDYDYEEDERGQPFRLPIGQFDLRTAHINAIAPRNEYDIRRTVNNEGYSVGADSIIEIDISYSNYDGKNNLHLEDYIMLSTGENGSVVIYDRSD